MSFVFGCSRCPFALSPPGDLRLPPRQQLWQQGRSEPPQVVLRCGSARYVRGRSCLPARPASPQLWLLVGPGLPSAAARHRGQEGEGWAAAELAPQQPCAAFATVPERSGGLSVPSRVGIVQV